jgi:hypothetical protein
LIPEIGITSTPVIDTTSQIIYVVAKTKDSSSTYHYKLHALDLTTGNERTDLGSPVEISASVPGTGDGGSTVTFKALNQLNRPALLEANGNIYIGFGSVGDVPTFRGWVLAYSARTLAQVAKFTTTPNSNGGGLWSTGNGLNADIDGNVYVVTGNGGTFDANSGGKDFGSAYIKLSGTTLSVLDYFAPSNWNSLNVNNTDLSSGGTLLIPGGQNKTLLVGGGKDAILRVMDTAGMGQENSVNSNLQNFTATNPPIFGTPIYWSAPAGTAPVSGPAIYLWGQRDVMQAWSLNTATNQFNTTPVSRANINGVGQNNGDGVNTAAASLSANGSTAGTGIVWAATPFGAASCTAACDANPGPVAGALYAFDATNLANELWDSQMNPGRDAVGNYAKFVPPAVANGKVYLATFSNQIVVYGLNPTGASSIGFVQVSAATPQSASASVAVAYPAAERAGDLNVVIVGWNDTTSTVQSVKDNFGNTYTLAIGPTKGTGVSQSIYYARNIVGGKTTVTVTFSQAAQYPDIRVLEYSGADPANPLDVTAGSAGNSATASSGSATTHSSNELIVGGNIVATGNKSAGTGFTARVITTPDSDLAEDITAASAGSHSATATLISSGPWVMQMATFSPNQQTGNALGVSVAGTGTGTVTSNPGGISCPTTCWASFASGTVVALTATPGSGSTFAGWSGACTGTGACSVTMSAAQSVTATFTATITNYSLGVTLAGTGTGTVTSNPAGINCPTTCSASFNSGTVVKLTAAAGTGSGFAGWSGACTGTGSCSVTMSAAQSVTATFNVPVSGFAFVQVNAATPQTASASVAVAYPTSERVGDLNVVIVGWNDTTSTVQSVLDNLGNTYTLAIGPTKGTGLTQSIYYARNIVGGKTTVTVTFNQAAKYPDIRLLEYSGADPTSPLDVTAGSTGNSATASSGSATTQSANELIIGANIVATGNKSAGTGFTSRIITTPDSDLAEDITAASAGSHSAAATLTSSGPWVMQMVTFILSH